LFPTREKFAYQYEHTDHYIGFLKPIAPGCIVQPGVFAFFKDLFSKNLPLRLAYSKIAGMNTRKGEAITRLCGREGR
jgi:hypothetical protein